MSKEYRADNFNVKMSEKIDKNGYLRIKGTFTKSGVFSYPQPDGSVIRELRHPDDVFKADSMQTLGSVPLIPIEQHKAVIAGTMRPNEASKFKHLGVTGENIVRTPDDCLDGSLTIFDKETINQAIKADEAGKPLQLSCSYEVGELEYTPGVYKGESYHRRQRGIVYGHATLLPKGRAGSRCHTRADSAGNSINNKKVKTMKIEKVPALEIGSGENIFRADAFEFEQASGTDKLLERSVQIGVALKNSLDRADAAEGELSTLKKTNKELQKKLDISVSQEQFRADLKDSVELLAMAEEIGVEVKDDFTPGGLKKAICLKIDPKLDVARADSSEPFLDGVFSGIKRDWKYIKSQQKTLQGLESSQAGNEVSKEEYEDHGNI
jgi:hypothetical protein